MISKRIFKYVALLFIGAGMSAFCSAQTTSICPTDLMPPNNGMPRVIFPMPPIAGQPWQACYQNPDACYFPGGTPDTHLQFVVGPTDIDLKTQWKFIAFSPCPGKVYREVNMPAVTQAGPITIRLFQRNAELPLDPFVQTFEQVIQVQAAPISSIGVPALDWRAALGLSVLMIGVAGLYRRR